MRLLTPPPPRSPPRPGARLPSAALARPPLLRVPIRVAFLATLQVSPCLAASAGTGGAAARCAGPRGGAGRGDESGSGGGEFLLYAGAADGDAAGRPVTAGDQGSAGRGSGVPEGRPMLQARRRGGRGGRRRRHCRPRGAGAAGPTSPTIAVVTRLFWVQSQTHFQSSSLINCHGKTFNNGSEVQSEWEKIIGTYIPLHNIVQI